MQTMKDQNKIEVAVYLPDSDAQMFLEFQKHYETFKVLLKSNVFEQRNCAISLHFDSSGILQTIQRADFLYSRKHDLYTD